MKLALAIAGVASLLLFPGCATRNTVPPQLYPPGYKVGRAFTQADFVETVVAPAPEPEMLLLDDARFLITSGEVGWHNSIQFRWILPTVCEVDEGCNLSTNPTPVITYDITLVRTKAGTWFGPTREQHPDWFEWDPCHRHWHLKFASLIRLFNAFTGEEFGISHKEGFCWRNLRRYTGTNDPVVSYCDGPIIVYGYGDNYGPTTPCNGIDMTGVPPGYYILSLTIDSERRFGLYQSLSQLVYYSGSSVTNVIPPTLTIKDLGASVALSWSAGPPWRLQCSSDLATWQTMESFENSSPLVVPKTQPSRFFRLALSP